MKIKVHCSTFVEEVTSEGVVIAGGGFIPSSLVVWAAGVKAPKFLADIQGLETNRINQLVVTPELLTTNDTDIFAMGDCSACHWPGREEGVMIPPRAQAANEQASHLAKQIPRHIKGEPMKPFVYKDYGSLVALGDRGATGGLMGNLSKTWFIQGQVARFTYNMLYKSHQFTVKGYWKTFLDSLAGMIRKNTGPKVKLH